MTTKTHKVTTNSCKTTTKGPNTTEKDTRRLQRPEDQLKSKATAKNGYNKDNKSDHKETQKEYVKKRHNVTTKRCEITLR